MACLIPLRNNKRQIVDYAIVDAEDFNKVACYKWHKHTRDGYACANKNGYTIAMHNLVMNDYNSKGVVDHINRIRTDNRKCNLRIASYSLNAHNRTRIDSNTYKGIVFNKGKYAARITFQNTDYNLGAFSSAEDAARMYDSASVLIYDSNAANNNLLSTKEIAYLKLVYKDFKGLLLHTQRKARELPVGVYKSGKDKYYVMCHGERYTGFSTVKDAESFYKQRKKFIKDQKEDKLQQQPITRNEKGDAIIYLSNVKNKSNDYVIVDEEKWHELMRYSWYNVMKKTYAATRINGKVVMMHHYVCDQIVPTGMVIDHINKNHKDNRRCNLRVVTHSDNNQNKRNSKTTKSQIFHGITYSKDKRKWFAQISKDGIRYRLGHYFTPEEAALAYNEKAKELYDNPMINDVTEADIPPYSVLPGKTRLRGDKRSLPEGVRLVGSKYYVYYRTENLAIFERLKDAINFRIAYMTTVKKSTFSKNYI